MAEPCLEILNIVNEVIQEIEILNANISFLEEKRLKNTVELDCLPQCERCKLNYSSKCIKYNEIAWKCFYCKTINKALPGYYFTFFKQK